MERSRIRFLQRGAFAFQSKPLICFLIPLLLLLMLAFPSWESRMPTMWQALSSFLEAPLVGFLLLNCLIVTIIASYKLESDHIIRGHEEESQRESMIPVEIGDGTAANFVAENARFQSHNPSTKYAYDSMNQGKTFLRSSYSLDANYENQRKQEPIFNLHVVSENKPTRRARLAGRGSHEPSKPLSNLKQKKLMRGSLSFNDISADRHAKPAVAKEFDDVVEEKSTKRVVQSQPAAATAAVWPPAAAAAAMVTNPRRAGRAASNTPGEPAMAKHKETDHDDEEKYDSEVEELNRRAEKFIARFNDQMRLQRQESLKERNGRRLCNYDAQYAHMQLPVRGLMVG